MSEAWPSASNAPSVSANVTMVPTLGSRAASSGKTYRWTTCRLCLMSSRSGRARTTPGQCFMRALRLAFASKRPQHRGSHVNPQVRSSVSFDGCPRCVYRRGNIDQCAVWRMRPSAAQLPLAGRGVRPYVPILIGAWPSGKAPVFGIGIRRFESCRPSHFQKVSCAT